MSSNRHNTSRTGTKKPKETVGVSSNRHDTSRTVTKNPEETARPPNNWNKYKQEPRRTGKKRLLTDTNTTKEPVQAFITWYSYENPVLQLQAEVYKGATTKKLQGV